jgi:tetratricopeptide (TPR) repeat protein
MRSEARRAVAGLAFLALVGLAGPGRAADADATLRQKALALNEITGADPLKGQILQLLNDPEGTHRLLAVAVRMTKEKPQPFDYNATLILANTAENLKDVSAGETFYRLHAEQAVKLVSEQGLAQAYAGLIQLYYDNKKYAESEKVCREFLGLEGDESIQRLKPAVLRRLILNMAKQGGMPKAMDTLDRLIKADPDNWLNLDLKARVLREAGKLDEAVKVYEEVITRIQADKRLKKNEREEFADDYRYALSGLYVDLGQVDKAAEQLKALLAKDPNNPTYNNDLGYIWADHDMNLEESERLIRKAIEEDRKLRRKANPGLARDQDTAAYLDSLGWVLYKQKKYSEAKPYLLDAVKDPEGKHIEIYDHLGDVHLALGEKAEAVAAWKEGLKVAGSTKREQDRKPEIEKKLKANE